MLDTHACPTPTPIAHGPEKIYLGSTTVLVNDQMACRMGDILQGLGPPNPLVGGSPTVMIGDVGFGMAKPNPRLGFVLEGWEIFRRWDTLTTGQRRKALKDALNKARPTGMPSLRVKRKKLPAGTLGKFSFRAWSVVLSTDVLDGSMDEDRMAKLLNTAYHEGRHSEQWWNAAQHRAEHGDSAEQIRRRMAVPRKVGLAAARHPAAQGTSEGAMGEAVHTSVYGSRGMYRGQVLAFSGPDAYQQYRALPEEEDAWRHGDNVELIFRVIP
jgi:hypothetical protein